MILVRFYPFRAQTLNRHLLFPERYKAIIRLPMVDNNQLGPIPRGNTSAGVNRTIIEYLLSTLEPGATGNLLDIPCGNGEFLDSVKRFYPEMETYGADITQPPNGFEHHFTKIDAAHFSPPQVGTRFRIVACISGVMEFDNTLTFFEGLRKLLDQEGELIVSNDNLLTVRDRILYLLFGRHRQYKMAIPFGAPTWKIVPLQNLLRILHDAGFEATSIRYVPPRSSDWIWLPLAAVIFPFQYLYLRSKDEEQDLTFKRAMFPFVSLLSRHYIVVGHARSN